MAGIHWIVTNPDLKESLIPFHLPAWFGVSLIVIGGLTYAFHGHGD